MTLYQISFTYRADAAVLRTRISELRAAARAAQDREEAERLKRRILSRHGHLSNEAAGQALTALLKEGRPQVYLGHLSEENNVPELAYSTVAHIVEDFGAQVGSDVLIRMTYPDRAAEAVSL